MAPTSTGKPSRREGSNYCQISRLGERRIFRSLSKTITMPLEQWGNYDQELKLWTKKNGVYSYLVVCVRGLKGGSSL